MAAETRNSKAFYNTEIPSDWEVKALCEISKNRNSSLSINSLEDNFGDYLLYGASGIIKSINFFEEKEEYISIVKDGAGVGRVFLCEKDSSVLGTMAYIKPLDKNCTLEYLYFLFQSIDYSKYITGSTIPHIYFSSYSAKKIPLPPLQEQKAIAQVLSIADAAIHTTEKLITQKELRKKWLMQQLLTGKKRLKGFEKVSFKKVALYEILNQIRNALIPKEQTLYQQIGIRSHGKGIFYKEMVSGKALGNKRVFWVEANCLILNIVFAWEQAVAKTTESEIGMIASHRFPMFIPIEGKLHLDYILYFFKSPRGKQLLENASPGGAGRNKTLGQSEFINQIISLPTIEEQTAIAKVLKTADKEISLLKLKAEKLREQKKGLMQVLMTGKVRLKVNS